ncbi:MAG: GDSL-type esterase/lipase family protein [Cyanobacteria bacterium J06631_9]
MTNTPITIEAEDMFLSGYFAEPSKGYITLPFTDPDTSIGTASTQFTGTTGTYNIDVNYFDEIDGQAPFLVKVNGTIIDSWVANGSFGSTNASNQSRTTRTISGVVLNTGDTIEISAQENLGELGRVDSLQLVAATPTPTPPTPPTSSSTPPIITGLSIEAEDMLLSGFNARADKGYIELPFTDDDTSFGTASAQFNGTAGNFDFKVTYFDEKDGKAPFSVKVNGTVVDSWIANGSFGSTRGDSQSRTTRTISNVALNPGDIIQITAQEHLGELGRVDSLQLVASNGSSSGNNNVVEIMPLGDSITRGAEFGNNGKISNKNLQAGYRDHLSNLLSGNGINFDFVGSQNNGSGFDNDNEGHGGWTINQIANNVGTWLPTHKPEVILLNIGTNDMLSATTTVAQAISNLDSLIDSITSLRPTARLIVSSIGPINSADLAPSIIPNLAARINAYSAAIPGIVANKITAGKNVSFVDVGGALNANQDLEADGFHPNDAGNQKIANAFYGAINSIISSSAPSAALSTSLSNSNNLIEGTGNNDTLTGTTNDEVILGKQGNDILTGAGGADIFAYANASEGADTITDFSSNDRLQFSATGFGGGLVAGSALSTSATSSGTLSIGSEPISLGSSATFLFDTDSGLLQFDRDGNGAAYGAVNIATLTGVSTLSTGQIEIAA